VAGPADGRTHNFKHIRNTTIRKAIASEITKPKRPSRQAPWTFSHYQFYGQRVARAVVNALVSNHHDYAAPSSPGSDASSTESNALLLLPLAVVARSLYSVLSFPSPPSWMPKKLSGSMSPRLFLSEFSSALSGLVLVRKQDLLQAFQMSGFTKHTAADAAP